MYDRPPALAARAATACRAALWGGVRWVLRAMVHMGWSHAPTGVDPYTSGALEWVDQVGRPDPKAEAPDAARVARLEQPPPGHPERLAWPEPMSAQERELWGQLDDRAA
ncbi:DUF6059 family protein [Streptomyces sp. NPDC002851]